MALTSCLSLARRGEGQESRGPTTYGAGLSFTPPERVTPKKKGRLIIYVVDLDGRGIPGAYVDYEGMSKGRMLTDDAGRASARVPKGPYEVSVPFCGKTVLIKDAVGADVIVPGGGKAGGPLARTTWELRYRPTPSVRLGEPAPWERGEQVGVGVRVEDGCTFRAAPGEALAGFAWRASGKVRIVSSNLRADDDGFAYAVVECTGRGDGSIEVYNTIDDEQRVAVLEAASAPAKGASWCR